jgi:hypothetical protein
MAQTATVPAARILEMGPQVMSPSSSQQWARSSQQWARRIRYSDQNIRVSDAERNAVAELLGQHYADGRLDQAEFDERISRTMAAKTRGDLEGLFDDLPDLGPAATAPGASDPARPADAGIRPRRRGGILRPLAIVALFFVLASVAWHAFASIFFIGPVTTMIVIVACIVLVTRSSRRRDW